MTTNQEKQKQQLKRRELTTIRDKVNKTTTATAKPVTNNEYFFIIYLYRDIMKILKLNKFSYFELFIFNIANLKVETRSILGILVFPIQRENLHFYFLITIDASTKIPWIGKI